MSKYTFKNKNEMNLGDSETTQQLLLKLVDIVIINESHELEEDIVNYESTFETSKGALFKVTVSKISKSEKQFGTPTYYFKPIE
jgi:hypothetical protein